MRMAKEKGEQLLPLEAARLWCKEAQRMGYLWDVDQHAWFMRSHLNGVWQRDRLGIVRSEIISAAQQAKPKDTGNLARYFEYVATCEDGLTITSDQWDQHLYAFGAPNGVFELMEGCAIEPVLDLKVSKMVGAPPGGDCPRWKRFLLECCEDDADLVAFLHRWAGYALSALTVEHVILFVHGPGGNGKSVFVDTLRHAWGEYARTLPMDALMEARTDRHPAEIAMLRGARLAIATETQEGRRWDDAKVKQLTGGDRIVARHMRQDWFEFEPTFKLIVVGNHAPQIATVDDAMRRRLCMVPFNNKPSMPDAGLGAALRGEAPGILQWAMEGFEAYRAAGGLNPPERVLKATKAYLDEQDTVGAWLEDCCEVDRGGWTASADLFRSWSQWCTEAGMHPKSIKRLAGDLARKGVVAEKHRGVRGFANIMLRVDALDGSWTDRQNGYMP